MNITVARTIPAPAEEVFDVLIDPKCPGGLWFGVERVILNPVVDGLFYHLVNFEGRSWPHYGRFIQIDRAHRIEFAWVSEATKGIETVVSVTLEPRGEQTQVTLLHTGCADDEMSRGHEQGWTWYLSILAEKLSAKPATET